MNERNADFWRGVKWAADQAEDEARDLQEIRDSYIEARKTGTHGGRRISDEMAKQFAQQFRERSDALFLFAERIGRADSEVNAA
jgi:hypothetical protein